MTVEQANFVSQLNTSWPLDGDLIKEGDDHIRKIKTTLTNTFAGFDQKLTITAATMNRLDANLKFADDSVSCNKTMLFDGNNKTINFNKGGITVNKNVVTGIPLPRMGNNADGSDGLDDAISRRYLEKNGGMIAAWPVGSIYISATATNPADLFGFGTWQQFAPGRVLVGYGVGNDGTDSINYNTVLAQGGKYYHTLTSGEMPSHSHPHDIGGRALSNGAHYHRFMGDDGLEAFNFKESYINYDARSHGGNGGIYRTTTDGAHEHSLQITGGVQTTGGNQKHNNIQPYIVVYMFRRTA